MIIVLLVAFLLNIVPVYAQSMELVLPAPGQMVKLSQAFAPISLQGLKIDPQNPMRFDFILRDGQKKSTSAVMQEEGMNLVRYFLAALTMPEKDVWVNLSPFEHDRIIPQELSLTRMGRDMLAQDYILKQMTSSLLYPNDGIGQEFWKKVYTQAKSGFAGAQIPVSSFNKVWIMPDRASVLTKGQTVIITASHLRVILDHDYHAAQKMQEKDRILMGQQEVAEKVMREVIVPVLEKEINEGEHFSMLRQIFQAAILAEWYKRHFRQSLIGQQYTDQHKVTGIDETPAQFKEELYQQYLQAYKKGVYNFIREDKDPRTGESIPRKYFSGGLNVAVGPVYSEKKLDAAQGSNDEQQQGLFSNMDEGALHDMQVYMNGEGIRSMAVTPTAYIARLENPYWTQVKVTFDNIFASSANSVNLEATRERLITKNVRITSGWIGLGDDVEVFAVRVANDATMGTPKGGIRWTKASDMLKDDEFLHEWQEFLKMHPTQDEAKAFIAKWLTQEANSLAIGMTLKTAGLVNGLGGAKGDVFLGQVVSSNGNLELRDITPKMLSRVARAHARQLVKANAVGINIDSPAPDVNTNPEIMSWYTDEMIKTQVKSGRSILLAEVDKKSMEQFKGQYGELFDQLSNISADNENDTPYLDAVYQFWQANVKQGNYIPVPWLGVFTGLAVEKGGVAGRASATGEGVVAVIKAYYQSKEQDYYQKTVAVQGFGNVGSFTAIAAAREGFKVRVINDKDITLIKEDGFSEFELIAIADAMSKNVSLYRLWKSGFINDQGIHSVVNDGGATTAQKVTEAVLWADVDVLIPAAMQLQISKDNVGGVKAGLVVEAANNPVYPDALKRLHERSIDVIPGILANAGGVFVSGLQMEQAATGRVLTQEKVTLRMTAALGDALTKLMIWNKTTYKGVLSEAYVHYVLTRLWAKSVLPDMASIAPVIVVKRDALSSRFPNGGAIYDRLVVQGYVEPIADKEGSATFHRDSYWRVVEGIAAVAKNFKEVVQFIAGVDISKAARPDSAMINGGIDMNTSALKIEEQGSNMNLDLERISRSTGNIQGLVPVFVQMRPITIPVLLGVSP